jgi:hypothetical protein
MNEAAIISLALAASGYNASAQPPFLERPRSTEPSAADCSTPPDVGRESGILAPRPLAGGDASARPTPHDASLDGRSKHRRRGIRPQHLDWRITLRTVNGWQGPRRPCGASPRRAGHRPPGPPRKGRVGEARTDSRGMDPPAANTRGPACVGAP